MLELELAEKNLILKIKAGSYLYGTATQNSDVDYIGVFIPPKEYILGLKRCEQVEEKTNPSNSGHRNSAEDIDCTYYALPKFIKLAAENNPNILELLFAPIDSLLFCDAFGSHLRHYANCFVSRRVRDTFLGYALSQKKKIFTKKDRLDALKKACTEMQEVLDTGVRSESTIDKAFEVRGKYEIYKTYEKGTQYGYILRDLQSLLGEYGSRTTSIEAYGYDLKFASHLIRLLVEGIELLETGKLVLPLTEKQLLLDIRQGKYSLPQVEEMTRMYESKINDAFSHTSLPKTADFDTLNRLQIGLLEEYWEKDLWR